MKNKLSWTLAGCLALTAGLGMNAVHELKDQNKGLTMELISEKSTTDKLKVERKDLTKRLEEAETSNTTLRHELSSTKTHLAKVTNQLNNEVEGIWAVRSLGKFEATSYTTFDEGDKLGGKPGNRLTASGKEVKVNHTVAVDPRVIPLGTKLYIKSDFPGMTGFYTAEDTGSAVKGNKIDIYTNNINEAKQFGRRSVQVYIIEK